LLGSDEQLYIASELEPPYCLRDVRASALTRVEVGPEWSVVYEPGSRGVAVCNHSRITRDLGDGIVAVGFMRRWREWWILRAEESGGVSWLAGPSLNELSMARPVDQQLRFPSIAVGESQMAVGDSESGNVALLRKTEAGHEARVCEVGEWGRLCFIDGPGHELGVALGGSHLTTLGPGELSRVELGDLWLGGASVVARNSVLVRDGNVIRGYSIPDLIKDGPDTTPWEVGMPAHVAFAAAGGKLAVSHPGQIQYWPYGAEAAEWSISVPIGCPRSVSVGADAVLLGSSERQALLCFGADGDDLKWLDLQESTAHKLAPGQAKGYRQVLADGELIARKDSRVILVDQAMATAVTTPGRVYGDVESGLLLVPGDAGEYSLTSDGKPVAVIEGPIKAASVAGESAVWAEEAGLRLVVNGSPAVAVPALEHDISALALRADGGEIAAWAETRRIYICQPLEERASWHEFPLQGVFGSDSLVDMIYYGDRFLTAETGFEATNCWLDLEHTWLLGGRGGSMGWPVMRLCPIAPDGLGVAGGSRGGVEHIDLESGSSLGRQPDTLVTESVGAITLDAYQSFVEVREAHNGLLARVCLAADYSAVLCRGDGMFWTEGAPDEGELVINGRSYELAEVALVLGQPLLLADWSYESRWTSEDLPAISGLSLAASGGGSGSLTFSITGCIGETAVSVCAANATGTWTELPVHLMNNRASVDLPAKYCHQGLARVSISDERGCAYSRFVRIPLRR
jgi:hypothetical protein